MGLTRMPNRQRRYTEADKALALAVFDSCDGSFEAAARQAGVPRNTLRRWVDDRDSAAPATLRQETADDLGGRFGRIASLATGIEVAILERLAEMGVSDLGLGDLLKTLKALAPGAGIATDKMLLLTGRATERHEVRIKDVNEALDILRGAYHDGPSTT